MPKTTTTARSFPLYTHYCKQCVWLGDYQEEGKTSDLYFCPNETTIIARYADDPGDYNSGLVFGIISDVNGEPTYPALREALIRALLIPESRAAINEHVLKYEFPNRITEYQEILKEADLRKVQKELEAEAIALIEKYKIPVTGQVAMEEMSNTELRTLLAYEYWKDGMDWAIAEAFRTAKLDTSIIINVLVDIFGYTTVCTMKG